MSLNRFEGIGHLGKDPEIKVIGDNVSVANFSVAITERGGKTRDGKEYPESTTWVNVVAWRGLADIAERFLKKGSHIYFDGKLTTRSYDATDGTKRYVTEVVLNKLEMLGSKNNPEPTSQANTHQPSVQSNTPDFPPISNEDDLPF